MKIFLRVLLGLAGLALVMWLAFFFFAAPVLKSVIEKKLTYYSSDSVRIGSLELQFFPLGLSMSDAYFNLFLPADSLLVQWQGNLSHAEVGGVDWYKAWKEDVWDVGLVKIGEGEVNWRVTEANPADTARFNSKPGKTKPDLLLRDIKVRKMNLRFVRNSFAIHLQTSINLDSVSIKRQDSVQWKLKRVVFHSEDAAFENLVEDYDLRYRQLNYDSEDSLLTISGFKMEPRLSRAEFAEKYPYRKVQPSLYLPRSTLSGIDLDRLHLGFFAHKVLIDSAHIEIYQDLRKERPEVYKPLPSELIAKIPFPIEVDSMHVTNALLKYQHQGKQKDAGLALLHGKNLNLSVYPISNIGHSTSADVSIDGSLLLMEQAQVTVKVVCFADKPNHDFKVDLTLSATAFSAFDKLLYPTIGIRAKDGYCEGARVKMYGNDFSIRGKLDIAYRDLKIALPADQKVKQNILGRAGEALGNFALVNSNNSMGANNGHIFYKRVTKEPFVNYWWKGVQSGLMDAIIRFYENPDKE